MKRIYFAGQRSDRLIVAVATARSATWYTEPIVSAGFSGMTLVLFSDDEEIPVGKELSVSVHVPNEAAGAYTGLGVYHPAATSFDAIANDETVCHYHPAMADAAAGNIITRRLIVPPVFRLKFTHAGTPPETYNYTATLLLS